MRGGGVNADEVFYNFNPQKVTKLKVKIENPGNYGFVGIDGDISADKPTIIDWGNGVKTTLTTPITNSSQANKSTDWYTNYDKPGEYVISIDGWYKHFQCYGYIDKTIGVTQINEVLTEIIQVSSLITSFYQTFNGCKKLRNIPSGLFDNCTSIGTLEETFYGCSRLTSIPSGLFDKNINVNNFHMTFMYCSNLTGETPYTLAGDGKTKIKLWDRDETNGFAKPTSTNWAFNGCTKLDDYEQIPDNWK